jgi:hypothetical protein
MQSHPPKKNGIGAKLPNSTQSSSQLAHPSERTGRNSCPAHHENDMPSSISVALSETAVSRYFVNAFNFVTP